MSNTQNEDLNQCVVGELEAGTTVGSDFFIGSIRNTLVGCNRRFHLHSHIRGTILHRVEVNITRLRVRA